MKRIAVIEDDSDIGFILRLNLEREGYGVTTFEHGQEGLTAVQRGGFDFVILDLNLPDLDGFTICRELRREQLTRGVPIMMLTARGSERDRVTGRSARAARRSTPATGHRGAPASARRAPSSHRGAPPT